MIYLKVSYHLMDYLWLCTFYTCIVIVDMRILNPDNISIVESFLRLYSPELERRFGTLNYEVVISSLSDEDNDFHDIAARLGKKIFISRSQTDSLGLTFPEIYALIAHELGHIFYHTDPWDVDGENRADSLAAELGLADQMISVIEKIIQSRRFRNVTSLLVQRIQFLKHLA